MNKYIRYTLIVLWQFIRKVVGLVWFFVALPFRKYARNVVYNYVLQNDVYLKRLLERPLEKVADGWIIKPFHGSEGGYINYRKIGWLEYQLVFWTLWGWLDDDSNYDTIDKGYCETLINKERFTWIPQWVLNSLSRDVDKLKLYGNTFDIGDKRGDYPEFGFWSSYLWLVRNTAYNFKYMLHEEDRPEMMFRHEVFGFVFGYDPDGRLILGAR